MLLIFMSHLAPRTILQAMKYVPQTFGELAEKILLSIVNCAGDFHVARVGFVSDRQGRN